MYAVTVGLCTSFYCSSLPFISGYIGIEICYNFNFVLTSALEPKGLSWLLTVIFVDQTRKL